jgi:hypothetical protein
LDERKVAQLVDK